MTVREIESVDKLDPVQSAMLADALREHRDLRHADLVVYRMRDGRAVVAPRSGEIGPGSHVVAAGWVEALSQADSAGSHAELHVAKRLVSASDS
jgi:hypothetical protein